MQTLFNLIHCQCMPPFLIFFPFRRSLSHSVRPFCLTSNLHLQMNSSPKFKQGTKRYFTGGKEEEKRSMNQKARKWNSLYKRRGNFNVRQGTVELCSVLAGCGGKRAAATAGYIYSDKSLQTLKSLSKVCLFKRH